MFLKNHKYRTGAKKGKYDFLDLGCKKGGSIEWNEAHHGGRGLGVDFEPKNVKNAIKNGYDVIYGDVLKLDFPENSFKFVSMMDFLEHLPGEDEAKKVIENCSKWAREFFFIHHPSFESVEYLEKHGFKLDWTDWSGHSNPLTIKDFKRIFSDLGLSKYEIKETKKITDSGHNNIVPLDAPEDTIGYHEKLGKKKKVAFDKPVYSRVELVISTQ